MRKRHFLLPLLAIVFSGPRPLRAQDPAEDRKVTIEVITTQNGDTSHVRRELDHADHATVEEALRELGVLGELNLDLDGGNEHLTIDIRRMVNEELERELALAMSGTDQASSSGYLGVNIANLDGPSRERTGTSAETGALILEVIEGSPAEHAGLMKDDIITRFDGRSISSAASLTEAVRAHKPGEQVSITYYRGDRKHSTTVKLGVQRSSARAYMFKAEDLKDMEHERDEMMKDIERMMERRAFLGVTPGQGEAEGALIGTVENGSTAETMGLMRGDVVKRINDRPVADFDELAGIIRGMSPGDAINIQIERDGRTMEMSGNLGERETGGFRMRMIEPGDEDGLDLNWAPDPAQREELRREMDQLRREMDELRREMRNGVRREMRVTIDSRALTPEEKELLQRKGITNAGGELELQDLKVSPNPGTGLFRIQFTLREPGDLGVRVYDAQGERVYQETISNYKGLYDRTLDLSDRAPGTYFVVIDQKGRTAASKLVKQ